MRWPVVPAQLTLPLERRASSVERRASSVERGALARAETHVALDRLLGRTETTVEGYLRRDGEHAALKAAKTEA